MGGRRASQSRHRILFMDRDHDVVAKKAHHSESMAIAVDIMMARRVLIVRAWEERLDGKSRYMSAARIVL